MKTSKIKTSFRIETAEKKIKFAGTGENSWFTLDEARKLVDYSKGERIVESNGVEILWEVF